MTNKYLFINLLDPSNIMFTEAYVNELQAAGVGAENVTIAAPWCDTKETVSKFAEWLAFCKKYHERTQLVTRPEDIADARTRGTVGIIFGLQAANPLGENLRLLEVFYRIGLRIVGITYQGRNAFGDGCAEPKDSGLSKLGEKLVEESNRLGILLDLSHTGRKATLEAIDISDHPVIFSHSVAKTLCNNVRNLDDEQIKAVAEKGGVIGVASFSPILRQDRMATLSDVFDQIDYLVKLAGVDHVGIGLDANPLSPKEFWEEFKRNYPEIVGPYSYEPTVEGLKGPAQWKNIASGLAARGYSEGEIGKILGENAFRVFKQVWKN